MFDTVYKPTLYALIGGVALALISQVLGFSVISLILVVVSFIFLIITMVMTRKQEKILAELPEFTREKKKKKKEELYDLDSVAEEEKELERYKKAKVIVENEVTLEKMYLEKGTLMYRLRRYIPFMKYEEPKLMPLRSLDLDDDFESFGLGGDGSPTGGKLSELSMGTPEEPTFFKSSGKYVREQTAEELAEAKYEDEVMNKLRDSIKAKHEESSKKTQREYVIDLDEDTEVWVPGMNMRTGKRDNPESKKDKKFPLPTLSGDKKSISKSDASDKERESEDSPVVTLSEEDLWGYDSSTENVEIDNGGDFGGNVGIFNSKKEEMFIPYGEDKTNQTDSHDEEIPDWLIAIQNEGSNITAGGKELPQQQERVEKIYQSVSSEDVEEDDTSPNGLFANASSNVLSDTGEPSPSDDSTGSNVESDSHVGEFVVQEERLSVSNVQHEKSQTEILTDNYEVSDGHAVEELFETLQDEHFIPPYSETDESEHESNALENVAKTEVSVENVKASVVHADASNRETVESTNQPVQSSEKTVAGDFMEEISAPIPSARFLRKPNSTTPTESRRDARVSESVEKLVTKDDNTASVVEEGVETERGILPKLDAVKVEKKKNEAKVSQEKVDKEEKVELPSREKRKSDKVSAADQQPNIDVQVGQVNNITPVVEQSESIEVKDADVEALEGETVSVEESEVVNVVEIVTAEESESHNVDSFIDNVSSEVELSSGVGQPVLVTQPEVATIANQIASLLSQAEVKAQESVEKRLAEMERQAEEERQKLERNWQKILEKVKQEAMEERKAIEAKAEEEKVQLVEEKERALEDVKRMEGEKVKLARQNESLTESLDEAEDNLNKVLEAQSQVAESATMATKLHAVSKLRKIRQESENMNAPDEVVQLLDDFINDFRK